MFNNDYAIESFIAFEEFCDMLYIDDNDYSSSYSYDIAEEGFTY